MLALPRPQDEQADVLAGRGVALGGDLSGDEVLQVVGQGNAHGRHGVLLRASTLPRGAPAANRAALLLAAGARPYASRDVRFLRVAKGDTFVSIVRVGLGETKNFAEGYELIFGKKKTAKGKKEGTPAKAKKKKARKKS